MLKKADGTFVEDVINCDMSNSALTECEIPMLQLPSLTGLQKDQLVQAKVRAMNAKGWGNFSEINVVGQHVNVLPSKTTPITIDFTEVKNDEIMLRWHKPVQSLCGGKSVQILNYHIEVKSTADFAYLTTISASTTEYLHTGLTGGQLYTYRLKIENYLGMSEEWSAETAFQTAQAPE